MKIFFKVTDTSEDNAKNSLDTVELLIENQWRRLETLLALMFEDGGIKPVMARLSATEFGVWLNFPVEIQSVRFTNALAAVITPAITYLSMGDKTALKKFTEENVAEFQAGKNYLIPYTAGAVTDMLPDSTIVPIEGTSDAVFVGTHYNYRCTRTHNILGATNFTALTYAVDLLSIASNGSRRADKAKVESMEYVSALIH